MKQITGFLRQNSDGRYYLPMKDGFDYEFTSGTSIEYLHCDEHGNSAWKQSRIEHNGRNYYIVDYGDDLDRLKVRIKIEGESLFQVLCKHIKPIYVLLREQCFDKGALLSFII